MHQDAYLATDFKKTLQGKEVCIVANGDFLPETLIKTIVKNKVLIALDGAADRLTLLKIRPDIILGDFDSIQAHHFKIQKTFADMTLEDQPYLADDIYIVPAKNQAQTDLTKAILFCDQHKASKITVICATGGRLDHHEGALRSLRGHYKKVRPLVIHTASQTLQYVANESITIKGKPGDKVGILAYPEGTMTSEGLQYEATDYPLEFGFHENICNAMKNNAATLTIQGEALVISPLILS